MQSYPAGAPGLATILLLILDGASGCATCDPISSWESDRPGVALPGIPEGWCLEEQDGQMLGLRRLHPSDGHGKFWERFRFTLNSAPGGISEVVRHARESGYTIDSDSPQVDYPGVPTVRFRKQGEGKAGGENRFLWVAVLGGTAYAAELVAPSTDLIARGRLDRIVGNLRLDTFSDAMALFRRAEKGQTPYEDVLRALDSSLQSTEPNPRAYLFRGVVNLRLERVRPAVTDLDEAARRLPQDPRPLQYLGHALFKAERYQDAMASWEAAAELDPALEAELAPWVSMARGLHAEAYYAEGIDLASRELYEEAERLLGRATELNPEMIEAYLERGNLLLYRLHRFDEARKIFAAAVRIDPADAEAFLGRGISRFHANDNAGAVEDITWALALGTSKREDALLFRGMALFELGRRREAKPDLVEAAESANPDWKGVIDEMLKEMVPDNRR